MSHSKLSFAKRRRLNTAIKAAALVAALAFVTVVLEEPRLTASPKQPRETAERSLNAGRDQAKGAATAEPERAGESMARASASEQSSLFIPGQLGPPRGEVEAQPPSF